VVWIVVDAMRTQSMSCYGYERLTTPNLAALAEKGVLFKENFANSFWTKPSVAQFMTGRLFPMDYLNDSPHVDDFLLASPASESPLPKILEENGYQTALFSAHYGLISER